MTRSVVAYLALTALASLANACGGSAPPPAASQSKLRGDLFVAEFPNPPKVRWESYSLVWETCDEERLIRVSCSALWDGELHDQMLAAKLAGPGVEHYSDVDRRDDPVGGVGRRIRFVEGGEQFDARLIVVNDSLFIASVQSRADERAEEVSDRFLDSFSVSPQAACPTTHVVRINQDQPLGEPVACGPRSSRFFAATRAPLKLGLPPAR